MQNRLNAARSPWLHRHADSDIAWQPWDDEAFALARATDRPVVLVIGFASCHWCKRLSDESFTHPDIQARLRDAFVPVLVDRLARPDLDEVYLRAVQSFTGGKGGWPLIAFLTPDGLPFYGTTFLPPTTNGRTAGLLEVLQNVGALWRDERPRVTQLAARLGDLLTATGTAPKATAALRGDLLQAVADAHAAAYDARNGGFGGAPKFPPHGALTALQAAAALLDDARAARMVDHTLSQMAQGGLLDLVDGGFHRYCVDPAWRFPQFERQLSDNAWLLAAYVDHTLRTGDPASESVARGIAHWALSSLRTAEGGFAAGLAADTAEGEGARQRWTRPQLHQALGPEDGDRFAQLTGIAADAGLGDIPHLDIPAAQQTEADRAVLARAWPRLRSALADRAPAPRDEQEVTAWNAWMSGALAKAGAALGEPGWVQAAAEALDRVIAAGTPDGRLRRITGDAGLGFADDQVAVVGAAIDLFEATGDLRWLDDAERTQAALDAHFWDDDQGVYRYVGDDAPAPPCPSVHLIGGAEPNPNGAAALQLVRLGALRDRPADHARATQILQVAQGWLATAPRALGVEAVAAQWLTAGGARLAITGPQRRALVRVAAHAYRPTTVVAALDAPSDRLPWTRQAPSDLPAAATFVGLSSCEAPLTEADALRARGLGPVPTRPTGHTEPIAPANRPVVGWPDPDADWLQGGPFTADGLRGNLVALCFVSPSDIRGRSLLAEVDRLLDATAGQPVCWIGVLVAQQPSERDPQQARAALDEAGVRLPVVHDPTGALASAYGLRSLPTVVLVDTAGREGWRQAGETDAATLLTQVARLLSAARAAGTAGPVAWSAEPVRAPTAALRHPAGLTVWPGAAAQEAGADPLDGTGRVYVADTGAHRVWEFAVRPSTDGWPELALRRRIGTGAPGFVDGDANRAQFRSPRGLARHGRTLWVADTDNHAVRAIDLATGDVGTAAGTGARGDGHHDPYDPLGTPLRSPWDVAVGGAPDAPVVFLAMAGDHRLWVLHEGRREIGPFAGSGAVDHVDGPLLEAALAQPSGLCLTERFLFFTDADTGSVRAVAWNERQVVTVSGRGPREVGDADGPLDAARLELPRGVAAQGDVLHVADTANHKIKAMDLRTRHVRTLAGADGGLARPGALARCGPFLLVADTGNHRVVAIHTETGELRPLWPMAPADAPSN